MALCFMSSQYASCSSFCWLRRCFLCKNRCSLAHLTAMMYCHRSPSFHKYSLPEKQTFVIIHVCRVKAILWQGLLEHVSSFFFWTLTIRIQFLPLSFMLLISISVLNDSGFFSNSGNTAFINAVLGSSCGTVGTRLLTILCMVSTF